MLKIEPGRLTNFHDTHNHDSETAIAQWFSQWSGWRLIMPPIREYFPDFDFVVADPHGRNVARGEIKISSKGASSGTLELSRANGEPSGLSATRADFYLLLNTNGSTSGKIRLVRTYHLRQYAATRKHAAQATTTRGDKLGSMLLPLDLTASQIVDLMVAELPWDNTARAFDFDPAKFKYNAFAANKIHSFLRKDQWR